MPLADLPSLSISFPQVLIAVAAIVATVLVVTTFAVIVTGRAGQPASTRHWISRLLYAGYLASIVVLAMTAFGSILSVGHMSGYALLAHVSAAGGFVFLMVAIAFLYLPTGMEIVPAGVDGAEERTVRTDRWWVIRWSAWGLVISSLIAAGTMLISMLPVLDTGELVQMAILHRYAGLCVVVFAIFHLYSLLCARVGYR